MKENKNRLVAPIGFVIFLTVFGFLALGSSVRYSPTVDESVHLASGYSYLKWGDYRANPEHPPLIKMWAALPLLWLGVKDPRPASPTWEQIPKTEPGGLLYPFATDMLFRWNDAATLFFYAKLQMLVLSIVLAIFIYMWSRELFGATAAIIAIFLYGLDPNILAHSAIIHTDLPFAGIVFIATYFYCRTLKEFTWYNLLLSSLLFGLAAITKHSVVVILPIWLALSFAAALSHEPQRYKLYGKVVTAASWPKTLALGCMLITSALMLAWLLIWAIYGFRFNAVPGGATPLFMSDVSSSRKPIAHAIQSIVVDHRIFPEALIAGYLYNLKIWRHAAYLLGSVSDNGFWSYFPVAFVVKTPLPTLILLLASLVGWTIKRRLGRYVWLIVPPVVYFTLAILSRFNIGIRHLLPVYPFLFVWIAGYASELWRQGSRKKRAGLVFLGLWYLWSSLSSYPHYLSYFNELVGGAKNGHKVLLDSNLDWGQDLKGLKTWMDDHAVRSLQLFYFGTAEPKYYGIDDFYSFDNLSQQDSKSKQNIELPSYMAVSANFLYGGELFLPIQLAKLFVPYRSAKPVAAIGHSIYVYRVDLADSRTYENAAVVAARKGAFHLAATLFETALELNPTSADTHLEFGNLWARQGRFDEAAAHYRAILKIQPAFAQSYINLGRNLMAQKRVDEAVENFRAALRVEPENAEIHQDLARALAQQGKVVEAAHHLEIALRLLKQTRHAPSNSR